MFIAIIKGRMKLKLFLIAILAQASLGSAYADEPSTVGLKGLKSLVNRVAFASASLEKTGASTEVIRLEQRVVNERTLHIGELTQADAVLESLELSQNAIFVKFAF